MMWLRSTYDTQDRRDMYNGIVHCPRIAETMMKLLEDDVYVYHYKMAMKEASNVALSESGRDNRWEWHQGVALFCMQTWYGLKRVRKPQKKCVPLLARHGFIVSLRVSSRSTVWTDAQRSASGRLRLLVQQRRAVPRLCEVRATTNTSCAKLLHAADRPVHGGGSCYIAVDEANKANGCLQVRASLNKPGGAPASVAIPIAACRGHPGAFAGSEGQPQAWAARARHHSRADGGRA